MALPTTREEFKTYILRELGAPVLKINVSDDQVDDRIDEAIAYYWQYHFDGVEKMYYKHLITANTITDGYITMPENIIGAVRVFSVGSSVISSSGMFNLNYQIALNDLWAFQNNMMLPLYLVQTQMQFMQQMLSGQPNIRYNRHRNQLHVDIDWSEVQAGQYFIVECYQVVDPEDWPDVWSDLWLLRYAAALVRKQWGTNISKYDGIQLLGGVTMNGRQMLDDANGEIDDLLAKIQDTPLEDYIA